ncbi:hypothetical protein ETB97_000473 [Aspergillus alliaceus]|uniref:Nephrocystin 3-like N-terminal domain-containing protein n=1 Tax=Petromyces alliaceus TaxID=209559 RepID=A0A8H6A1Z2_PETAA|nr:hypothetical protein ETB97_000473 [Aspergillus burnettii]
MSRSAVTQQLLRRVDEREDKSPVISNVALDQLRRSQDELDPIHATMLLEVSDRSLLEWIRSQRLHSLPPEGSSHDNVLKWAAAFIGRLRTFYVAIEQFDGAYLACRLGYGFCGMLLELGRDNMAVLEIPFSFFNHMSKILEDLLRHSEIVAINAEVREQMVLAFLDLLTLVCGVSIHIQKALAGLGLSVYNINETFASQIQTLHQRYEDVGDFVFKSQLLEENFDEQRVSGELHSIKTWLVSDDPVLAGFAKTGARLSSRREAITCSWIWPYVTRFLKSQRKTLCFAGSPGSGRSVLASVILDNLQEPFRHVSYDVLFVPINANIPAETTPRSVACSLLRQLFRMNSGSVPLYRVLSDALGRSRLMTDPNDYDTLLWNALESALGTRLPGSRDVVLIVDGVDEATCGELTLLHKLTSVTSKIPYVRMIVLGTQNPLGVEGQASVQITGDRTFDDICTVLGRILQSSKSSMELSDFERETIADNIAEASNGSFLWATLAAKCAVKEAGPEEVSKAVDRLVSEKPSTVDIVSLILQDLDPTVEAKQMLLWLATAERPLDTRELLALACVSIDKYTVNERKDDILNTLKPLKSILLLQDGLVYFRHGAIRHAVLEVFSQDKFVPVSDRHADLATRLLIYIKFYITQQSEPSVLPLGLQKTNPLLNMHPLLDFALRYWPFHFRNTTVFQNSGPISASKEFAKVLPISTTFIRLQNAIWDPLPISVSLGYRELLTEIYREVLGVNDVVTLQCVILSAAMYRQLEKLDEAIALFYEAAIGSSKLLTAGHVLTSEMVSAFLSLTEDKISSAKTDTMVKRSECLLLSVECCKIRDGPASEKHIVAMRQLYEHYHMIGDEQQSQQVMRGIESIAQQTKE